MRAPITVALLLILAMSALAGCIGGDEEPDPADDEEDEEAQSTATTGSIFGQVVDDNYEALATVEVVLIQQGTTIKDTLTNKEGRFTMNDVQPGTYRLHFLSTCCEDDWTQIAVEAGKEHEVDFQLFRIVDQFETYVNPNGEWRGFISCSIAFPTAATPAPCPGAADENRDDRHEFETKPGLMSIVVAMTWERTPTNTEDRMRNWLFINEAEEGEEEEWQSYSRHQESSPMEFRFDFEEPTEAPMQFQYRIYAGSGSVDGTNFGIVAQQEFTVYWHLFYGEPAPDGHSARPDA